MIRRTQGDILRDESEAIVNTVNCVGVMGRGIALQFRNAYPENYQAYEEACRRDEVQPGRMFITETGEFAPRFIINFPTKRHWRGKSRMEDIESGLRALVQELRQRNIRSVAIPPLGSGLGGLNWAEVRQRIEAHLSQLPDVNATIYEPMGAPPVETMARNQEVPNMTPGRAALVELMHRYLAGLLDPFVTLLEVHKLMYFMQEAGEPLKLRYKKAPYGPFAENLSHVLKAVEGYFISGYADGGDAPDKQLSLVPGAYDDAHCFLNESETTRERFERVSHLVAGFESPVGLELLATVHWTVVKEGAESIEEAIALTHAWNNRKRLFTSRQIGLATEALHRGGWITLSAS